MKNKHSVPQPEPSRFIGIDWADREHDIHTVDQHGNGQSRTVQQSPEAIEEWIGEELAKAGGPIAIILEQSRGALVHALMFRENVILYPVNPQQFAAYRKSYSNAGCKDDVTDAILLARMLRERISLLKPWQPDDENTRLLARFFLRNATQAGRRTNKTHSTAD